MRSALGRGARSRLQGVRGGGQGTQGLLHQDGADHRDAKGPLSRAVLRPARGVDGQDDDELNLSGDSWDACDDEYEDEDRCEEPYIEQLESVEEEVKDKENKQFIDLLPSLPSIEVPKMFEDIKAPKIFEEQFEMADFKEKLITP